MGVLGDAAAACGKGGGADTRSRGERSWGGMEERLGQGHIAARHWKGTPPGSKWS